MIGKGFKINIDLSNEISTYLWKDSKNIEGETSWLGNFGESSEFTKCYIHKDFGIALGYENIVIHGKNEKSINKLFSDLEKLSEEK